MDSANSSSDDVQRIFVLQLSQSIARLTEVGPTVGVREHPLTLPDDLGRIFEHADNDGDADRDRAQGSTGDRIERERFSRVVQDEVVRIVPDHAPLLLAATMDLAPAYRAVNTHENLLDDTIDVHPGSLDDRELQEHAERILARLRHDETSTWKEHFGTLRAQDLATTRLVEVAAAAAAAAIDELRFDDESDATGRIDEFGRIVDRDAEGAPRLVDEIATRVREAGGTVRPVRNADLLDGSPVAATLRFPVSKPE
jgi:hypothetical protein